jgi:hypothetical protein
MFIVDLFQDIFTTIQSLLVNIPLNNGLAMLYVILNALALIFLSGNGSTGGGGGLFGGLFGGRS